MGPSQGSFEPTESTNKILAALEIAHMEWIADEIRDTIRSGRGELREVSVNRGNRRRKILAHSSVPLNDNQQLRLAAGAIRAYAHELHEMWAWSQRTLQEIVDDPFLRFELVLNPGEEPSEAYHPDFEAQLDGLDHLLRQIAPPSQAGDDPLTDGIE